MKKKTYDKPMKGESTKSFKKFKIYDNLPPENRTIEKVAEILLEKEEKVTKSDKNYEPLLKKMITSLTNLSSRWFWVERSLMHDSEKLIEEQNKHKKEFDEVNKTLIECFKLIINSCKKRLIDLNNGLIFKANGEPYSQLSLVKMTYDITLTLKTANEQIRLCFGLSTDNKHVAFEGEVNQKLDVTTTNTLDMIKEVDEELAELYEPNTEHKELS